MDHKNKLTNQSYFTTKIKLKKICAYLKVLFNTECFSFFFILLLKIWSCWWIFNNNSNKSINFIIINGQTINNKKRKYKSKKKNSKLSKITDKKQFGFFFFNLKERKIERKKNLFLTFFLFLKYLFLRAWTTV